MLQGKREFMVSYLEDLQQAIENIDLGVIEKYWNFSPSAGRRPFYLGYGNVAAQRPPILR